ncbi:MAG: exosome complex exonuclease Rrp41 [Candidatus Aenigmatarchaeota archaeon]
MGEDKELIKNGERLDGRKPDEIREMEAEAGILKRADGSGYFRMGGTEVLAAVFGPRELHPKHKQKPKTGILQCRYNLAPFSVEDRKRPGPSRRAKEIGKVAEGALSSCIFLEEFPTATIDLYMEVISADAGTRCVALNAGAIALVDAGIPMKGIISACAAGKIEGKPVLDLMGKEDKDGQVDLPIAMNVESGEITLLQMDGMTNVEEMDEMLDLAIEGCEKVAEKQREALMEAFEDVE